MLVNNSAKASTIIEYKPQLDGLRFCAVLVVIFHHYIPAVRQALFLDIGVLVGFFFVLSSYLITKILLTSKLQCPDSVSEKTKVGIAFLIRRTLRIFPAYYLYLLLIILMDKHGTYAREHAGMFFSYLANFQLYADQKWDELTGHIWTLAVEEQFYLVWPWVVLFTPNRHLRKMFILFVVLGIASRAFLFVAYPNPLTEEVSRNTLTPTCLDCFGLGALLAYQHVSGKKNTRLWKMLFLCLLPVWVFTIISDNFFITNILNRFMVSLGALLLIEGANRGYNNLFGKFLQNKAVLYLARISYGIYLYHFFASVVFWAIFFNFMNFLDTRWGVDVAPVIQVITIPWISAFIYAALAILLATLSWYLLERPVNRLKRFVSYTARKKDAVQPVAPVSILGSADAMVTQVTSDSSPVHAGNKD